MKGSCLCGEIAYEIRSPIIGINYCHCTQCRKASGTAFATNGGVPRDSLGILKGQEYLSTYESSPGKKRYFCGNCGSPLYSEHRGSETVYVRLGTLDDDPAASPDVHIHVASKAPWYEINDELPKLQEQEDLWF